MDAFRYLDLKGSTYETSVMNYLEPGDDGIVFGWDLELFGQ